MQERGGSWWWLDSPSFESRCVGERKMRKLGGKRAVIYDSNSGVVFLPALTSDHLLQGEAVNAYQLECKGTLGNCALLCQCTNWCARWGEWKTVLQSIQSQLVCLVRSLHACRPVESTITSASSPAHNTKNGPINL